MTIGIIAAVLAAFAFLGMREVRATHGQPVTLFSDDFSRSKGNAVGNGWQEEENNVVDATISDTCKNSASGLALSGANYVQLRGDAAGDDLVGIDSAITRTISTIGHKDIMLSYWRAARGLEEPPGNGSDKILVRWRPQPIGPWIALEEISQEIANQCGAIDFNVYTFALEGAENLPNVEIQFAIIGTGENDIFLVDDVAVTGELLPQISEEKAASVAQAHSGDATIEWKTDQPATSRVIYDMVSHASLGTAPKYGYAFSTTEQDTAPNVTDHRVAISGLGFSGQYYYRVISRASPEVVGQELAFTTADSLPPVRSLSNSPGYGLVPWPVPASEQNQTGEKPSNEDSKEQAPPVPSEPTQGPAPEIQAQPQPKQEVVEPPQPIIPPVPASSLKPSRPVSKKVAIKPKEIVRETAPLVIRPEQKAELEREGMKIISRTPAPVQVERQAPSQDNILRAPLITISRNLKSVSASVTKSITTVKKTYDGFWARVVKKLKRQ